MDFLSFVVGVAAGAFTYALIKHMDVSTAKADCMKLETELEIEKSKRQKAENKLARIRDIYGE